MAVASATSFLVNSPTMQGKPLDAIYNPVYHIVEEPGGIDWLHEVDTPSEEYYSLLREDMGKRHPSADPHVLDHLLSTEAFLDKSIVSGFSYGVDKAQILVIKGKLLGNWVSSNCPTIERTTTLLRRVFISV